MAMSSEVKCEQCGTINLAENLKCRVCGWPLMKADPGFKVCPECGSVHTPAKQDTCISCGWDLGPSRHPPAEKVTSSQEDEACEHWSELPAHTSRTAIISVAGVLILLAGALGITHALLSALPETGSAILYHYENLIPAGGFLDGVIQDNGVIASLMFISGALAMVLSLSIIRRGNPVLAVASGILGIVAIGFLIGAFFALVGLLMLAVSRREFLAECR